MVDQPLFLHVIFFRSILLARLAIDTSLLQEIQRSVFTTQDI
jgi:hypothetical protein